MRNLILLSFILALVPFVFLKPHVGALLWAWVSFMYPHRLSWGFMYDFQLAMLIGSVAILAWLVSRERKVPRGDAVTILIILMAVWISITTYFAVVPGEAYVTWNRVIKILVMVVITITLINTRERLHALIWIVVISLGFYGAKGGVFTLLGGAENRVLGPPGSFIADNNSLSLALIMTVPLMRYLQLQSETWWLRLGLSGAMLLTLIAILGTYSRAALLGTATVLALLVIKSRKRLLVFGAGLAVAVFALAFTPEHWVQRMQSIADYERDGSAQGRFDAWRYSYRLSLDRPILGGGFNVFEDDELFLRLVPDAPKARSFHSIVFEMLGEHGWVGLLLFTTLLIAALVLIWSVRSQTRGEPSLIWARDLTAMAQVSLAGYVVTGQFYDHAFFDLYYHVLAIIAVTYGIVKREAGVAQARESAPAAYQQSLGTAGAVTQRASTLGENLGPGR